MAGLVLAESPVAHRIERLVLPLRDAFAAVFFFAFGLTIDPGDAGESPCPVAIAVVALDRAQRHRRHRSPRDSHGFGRNAAANIGLTILGRGEFSLILATLATAAASTPGSARSSPSTSSSSPSSDRSSRPAPTRSPSCYRSAPSPSRPHRTRSPSRRTASRLTGGVRQPPPTATKPATPIPPATRHEWAALATATLIATLIGILTLHEPPRVDHINIHNTTDYRIYIYASDPAHTSLTQVGIIAPHETRRFDDVLDRGPTWILHFHTQAPTQAPFNCRATSSLRRHHSRSPSKSAGNSKANNLAADAEIRTVRRRRRAWWLVAGSASAWRRAG